MTPNATSDSGELAKQPTKLGRRLLKLGVWVCGIAGFLCCAVIGLLLIFLNHVPASYPPARHPIPAPITDTNLGGGLDGFSSPYLGHTGSWDGKGGAMAGGSKIGDMDKEREMGLRWTFMPVYWRKMEPSGPVDASRDSPPAWQELDAFVIAAHDRKLNVLMQAPVVGGNAGGPPSWAGRREKDKSAPANMEALAEFAGKLAGRYRPGGLLARRQGWGNSYGVRAWELDNEPESYFTHWKNQAGDYAEFVTLAAAKIKASDAKAVIVAPGIAAGRNGLSWLEATLNAAALSGSPDYRARGKPFSIGPSIDVVSFHNYEGLDSAFSGEPRTIGQVLDDISGVFEKLENGSPGFAYSRKQEFWHTEGNFDFIGALSAERRAAWRMQFFTRAFAAGVRKVCVMDASEKERAAVGAYVHALPWPFPMQSADNDVKFVRGKATAFRHSDEPGPQTRQVWILWADANSGSATIEVPARGRSVDVVSVDGRTETQTVAEGRARIDLTGDPKMAPPRIVIDRAAGP